MNNVTLPEVTVIDAELGTKYGEAAKRFVDRYNNGNLTVLPRNKRDVAPGIRYIRDAKTGELLAFIEGEEDDDMLDEQPSNNT